MFPVPAPSQNPWSSITAPFSLASFSETSPHGQILSPHHRSAPPAPSTTLLPPTCLTSCRSTSPPAPSNHPQLVSSQSPTSHLCFTALRLQNAVTWEKCRKQTEEQSAAGGVGGRGRDNPYCFSLFSQVIFLLNPRLYRQPKHTVTKGQIRGARKMSFLALVIDAMSWQHNCLMPQHRGKTAATRLEGRLNYQRILKIYTQQRHRRDAIF